MDSETLRRRWEATDRLFASLLDLPRDQRDAELARRCPDDPELRDLVRSLLRGAESDEDVFIGPGPEVLASALEEQEGAHDGAPRPGDEIGRYRIRRELGRGGMATVYEAERSDGAYDQIVALKLLRRGLDTERIVERFVAERQILSSFAHPNVARLLDGGATADGRPYLVMERVEGRSITEWADAHGLGRRARLELFLQVTDAVSEAHRHLVVHRDIKPANILVDDAGRVKLLDFGIAKLLSAEAGSDLTELGPTPLTRRYASPEQRRGGPITTASDVYQLGLLLAELLTGESPFDRVHGGIAPGLPAEIGVVVGTALADEPDERYTGVDALAADLRRYLEGRPIEARPTPWWLRAGKWVKRNRWFPPVAALLVVGATAYIATLYVGLARLERERNVARAEAQRAQRIQGVLVDLFRSADAFEGTEGGRPDLTVVEALAPAVDRIRTDLSDDPIGQADLLSTVALVLHSLDRADEGLALVTEAMEIRRRSGAERTPGFARDLQVLAMIVPTSQQDSAAVLLEESVSILRSSGTEDDPRLAAALAEQMWFQINQLWSGDPRLGEEALAIYRAAGEGYRQDAAGVLSHLAFAYLGEGRLGEAEAAAREALEIQREISGNRSVRTALAGVALAGVLDNRARHGEAIPIYVEALDVLGEVAGPDHNQTLTTMNNLATTYQQAGRIDEAVALHREIMAARTRAAGGEMELRVGQSMQNLAAALADLGRLPEADSLAARAHEILVETTGAGHPVRAFPLLTRAEVLARLGDQAGAAETAAAALDILAVSLPANHYAIGVARCRLGAAWTRMGRESEGAVHLREGLSMLEADERTPPEYREECARAAGG